METAKYLREKDLKMDFLNKELKKNVNIEYIRNIIYNFITNPDITVTLIIRFFYNAFSLSGQREINSCN